MDGVSAIITAAGESTRMRFPKPLLQWHGVTLVEYQICSLLCAGVDEVIVVLGHKADEVMPYVAGDRVKCVLNPDYRLGKATSVKAGVNELSAADAVLLLAVDQPRTPALISRVINAHDSLGSLITSPRYQGHGGHPLIFSGLLIPELKRISEEKQGVREVFEAHRSEVLEVQIDDPMIRLDFNTPEAYNDAKKLYSA